MSPCPYCSFARILKLPACTKCQRPTNPTPTRPTGELPPDSWTSSRTAHRPNRPRSP